MKGSDKFKETIQQHLNSVAEKDSLFAETLKKENKNIDDCITYILNTVQKSGCNGFDDEEIYSMAIHYYDEDNIDIGKPISGKVVVNHQVQLTPEEIEAAKSKAIESIAAEHKQKITKKTNKPSAPAQVQESLFDGL